MSKTDSTLLTVERLREALHYSPETGLFNWKISTSARRAAGSLAGCRRPSGYFAINLDGVSYPAHRLALFWFHGKPSECQHVDHIDRNPSNNRLLNLRELTCSENLQNSKVNSRNVSGIKGVSWDSRERKWCASLQVNKRFLRLGLFKLMEDAVEARKAAEILHHPFRVTSESP